MLSFCSPPEAALAQNFVELPRFDDVKVQEEGVVFVCGRHNHVPRLHVRPATYKTRSTKSTHFCWLNFSMLFYCCRVEDTDDLVPIFNRQSDMLKRTYGEYFLAEVVAAQNDHMKCIIAEVYFYVSVSSEM